MSKSKKKNINVEDQPKEDQMVEVLTQKARDEIFSEKNVNNEFFDKIVNARPTANKNMPENISTKQGIGDILKKQVKKEAKTQDIVKIQSVNPSSTSMSVPDNLSLALLDDRIRMILKQELTKLINTL